MKKIPPHPNGGKHKWEHVRNTETQDWRHHRDGSQSVVIKYRAKYQCECGAAKTGRRP